MASVFLTSGKDFPSPLFHPQPMEMRPITALICQRGEEGFFQWGQDRIRGGEEKV